MSGIVQLAMAWPGSFRAGRRPPARPGRFDKLRVRVGGSSAGRRCVRNAGSGGSILLLSTTRSAETGPSGPFSISGRPADRPYRRPAARRPGSTPTTRRGGRDTAPARYPETIPGGRRPRSRSHYRRGTPCPESRPHDHPHTAPRAGSGGAQPALGLGAAGLCRRPLPAAATQLVAANLTRLIGQSELIVSGTVRT